MTLDQFKRWMDREIKRAGSQRQFAEKYGVDKSIVSLIMCGVREPSDEFTDALGWVKSPDFRRKPNEQA